MWSRRSRHERGYGTAWDKLRIVILRRDKYLCQPCVRDGYTTTAQEVDHIIPKAKGGTDDEDNLQSICTPCHKHKTYGKKNEGCNADGIPHKPNKYWA